MILTVEFDRDAAENLAFRLDEVGAWDASYASLDAWLEALPHLQ